MRVRMPASGPWATLLDHLVARLHRLPPEAVAAMLREGRVVDRDGLPVGVDAPFVPGQVVWTHRELRPEVEVPFAIDVLHQDERIVVVDKPHFVATMPRGRHVTQSAVARLRVELGLPHLTPAHRLDRLTAGVLLLTTEQRWRRDYQGLFAARAARKEYVAVAPTREGLTLPTTVRTHLVKHRSLPQAETVVGASANSESLVELVDTRDGLGRYRLVPTTGRTHQLRVHLSWLGIPILGDPLYPEVRSVADDDFTDPLQLLAASLAFDDPVDGRPRHFASRRSLQAWADASSRPPKS